MWQVCEPFHAVTYFGPELRAATDALGLRGGWMSYFACRAAPLGAVSVGVVTATFYNFHPSMVARAIPEAWAIASPAAVLDARTAGVDGALRRILGDAVSSAELRRAAELAAEAADAADCSGRPLALANHLLARASEPHLGLWQAVTVLREHRGDGHVAALVTAGLSPVEAHVTMTAAKGLPPAMMRDYRHWSEAEWAAGEKRLHERGWLDGGGVLTADGEAGRAAVENLTDDLAAQPWDALGAEKTAELDALMRDLSQRIVDGGGLMLPNPMGLPWPPD
jgi:hypothetical protein